MTQNTTISCPYGCERHLEHAIVDEGLQSAANSMGQASGPFLGGVLFVWQMNAPYVFTAALLVSVALAVAWNALVSRAGAARVLTS